MAIELVSDEAMLDDCGLLEDDDDSLDDCADNASALVMAMSSTKVFRLRLSPADADAFLGRLLTESSLAH